MGTSETGLNILRKIHTQTRCSSPWTRFILITAYPESVDFRDYAEVGGILRNDKESIIPMPETDSSASWQMVLLKATGLVAELISNRQQCRELVSQVRAPELYHVLFLRKD